MISTIKSKIAECEKEKKYDFDKRYMELGYDVNQVLMELVPEISKRSVITTKLLPKIIKFENTIKLQERKEALKLAEKSLKKVKQRKETIIEAKKEGKMKYLGFEADEYELDIIIKEVFGGQT